jgi:hypothetical protein
VRVIPSSSWFRRSTIAAAVVVSAAGCSSGGSSNGTSLQASATTSLAGSAAATSAAPCTNPQGGECLGPLAAGTYHTVVFVPQIRYTVPKGWGNFEDTPGNFLLIPPGGDLAGIDPGTSDFIGVYSGIVAAGAGCTDDGDFDVPATPEAIADHWAHRASLVSSKPRSVTLGGLRGVVLDLRPNPKAVKGACEIPNLPWGYEPLIHGSGPASLEHGMIEGLHLRVYLLALHADSTLAIEIDDLHGGRNLASYSKVAEKMVFGG